jgi:hypothetical protein
MTTYCLAENSSAHVSCKSIAVVDKQRSWPRPKQSRGSFACLDVIVPLSANGLDMYEVRNTEVALFPPVLFVLERVCMALCVG